MSEILLNTWNYVSTWIANIPTTQNPRIKKTLRPNNCWRSKSYHDACTYREYLSTNTQETGNTGCLWLGENVLGNRSRRKKLVTTPAFQCFKFCTMCMCWPVFKQSYLTSSWHFWQSEIHYPKTLWNIVGFQPNFSEEVFWYRKCN